MKIENVRISGCSIQANNLAHILKIIVRQTLRGTAWGKGGEVSPLVAAPGLFSTFKKCG